MSFNSYSYIADRGCLLVKIHDASVLMPNDVGDGDYTLIDYGKISLCKHGDLTGNGWREVASIEGEISIESNDCGTGHEIYRATGTEKEPISLMKDRHGNFAVCQLDLNF